MFVVASPSNFTSKNPPYKGYYTVNLLFHHFFFLDYLSLVTLGNRFGSWI